VLTLYSFAFVEYETPEQALAAIKALHGTPLDKKHTIAVNKLTDIDRYGKEGRISDEYRAPAIPAFEEKEHLRWWLADPNARDQFVMYRGESVGVYWNRKKENPDAVIDRQHWTEMFTAWSPLGTYLVTTHSKGIQLWGGPSWTRQTRFPHPQANMVDFSPNEKYVCTWSFKPIEVNEDDPVLTLEEDGKNYIIWDLATGKPLRSFQTHDMTTPTQDESGQPVKKKLPWPAFKWSADDRYVARMLDGQSISVYELPKMALIDKATIKIDGVKDFEWAPATPQRESIKTYEQLFCYWTPEIGSNPAKVGLMSIPSKEIVRTRNLFNVTDAKLHWQSQAAYVCVKVDRHSKSKKSLATNLEIFRVREKGVPVEVVDSIKDTVINFAWEPKGDRFVLITTAEVVITTAVPPKTSVSFFCPEKVKGGGVGNFKHIRTIDKKNCNGIYWSPKGRFVVVATIASQQSFDLDFWDLDYEGEKPESDKDLTANLQLMSTGDHYGVTDVDWDPTGRYVVTSASMWKQQASSIAIVTLGIRLIYPDRTWLSSIRFQRRDPPGRPRGEAEAVYMASPTGHAPVQGGATADPKEPARIQQGFRRGGPSCRRQGERGRGRRTAADARRMACLASQRAGGSTRRPGRAGPAGRRRRRRGGRAGGRRRSGQGGGRDRGGDCGRDGGDLAVGRVVWIERACSSWRCAPAIEDGRARDGETTLRALGALGRIKDPVVESPMQLVAMASAWADESTTRPAQPRAAGRIPAQSPSPGTVVRAWCAPSSKV
jgi:translation initiation factor 3 subunit B